MLTIHDIGVIEWLSVGNETFLLVESVAFGVALMNNDAGTDGSGLRKAFVGDFDAGEMAAAVLGDEQRPTPFPSRKGGVFLLGHLQTDGETEGTVVKNFCLLVIQWVEKVEG